MPKTDFERRSNGVAPSAEPIGSEPKTIKTKTASGRTYERRGEPDEPREYRGNPRTRITFKNGEKDIGREVNFEALETSQDRYTIEAVSQDIIDGFEGITMQDAELQRRLENTLERFKKFSKYNDPRFGPQNGEVLKQAKEKMEDGDELLANAYTAARLDQLMVVQDLLRNASGDQAQQFLALRLLESASRRNNEVSDDTIQEDLEILERLGVTDKLSNKSTKHKLEVAAVLSAADAANVGSLESFYTSTEMDRDKIEEAGRARRVALSQVVAISAYIEDPKDYQQPYSATTRLKTKVKESSDEATERTADIFKERTEAELLQVLAAQWDLEGKAGTELDRIDATVGSKIIKTTKWGEQVLHHNSAQIMNLGLKTTRDMPNGRKKIEDVYGVSIQLPRDYPLDKVIGCEATMVRGVAFASVLTELEDVAVMHEMLLLAKPDKDGKFSVPIVMGGKAKLLVVDEGMYAGMLKATTKSIESYAKIGKTYNRRDIIAAQLAKLKDTKEDQAASEYTLDSAAINNDVDDKDMWIKHSRAAVRNQALAAIAGNRLGFSDEEKGQISDALVSMDSFYAEVIANVGRADAYVRMAEARMAEFTAIAKGTPEYKEGFAFHLSQVTVEYAQLNQSIKNAYVLLYRKMEMLQHYDKLSPADQASLKADILNYLKNIDTLLLEQADLWKDKNKRTPAAPETTAAEPEVEVSATGPPLEYIYPQPKEDTITSEQEKAIKAFVDLGLTRAEAIQQIRILAAEPDLKTAQAKVTNIAREARNISSQPTGSNRTVQIPKSKIQIINSRTDSPPEQTQKAPEIIDVEARPVSETPAQPAADQIIDVVASPVEEAPELQKEQGVATSEPSLENRRYEIFNKTRDLPEDIKYKVRSLASGDPDLNIDAAIALVTGLEEDLTRQISEITNASEPVITQNEPQPRGLTDFEEREILPLVRSYTNSSEPEARSRVQNLTQIPNMTDDQLLVALETARGLGINRQTGLEAQAVSSIAPETSQETIEDITSPQPTLQTTQEVSEPDNATSETPQPAPTYDVNNPRVQRFMRRTQAGNNRGNRQ